MGSSVSPEMTINAGGGPLAVSPDGAFIVVRTLEDVGDNMKMILRVVDLKTCRIVDLDAGFGPTGGGVAMSPDGTTVAVGRGNDGIELWSLATRAVQQRAKVNGNDFLVFDPIGKYVYAAERLGRENGTVDRVDVRTGSVEHVFGPNSLIHVERNRCLYGYQITALNLLRDGNELFLAMPLGAVLWDLRAGREQSFVAMKGYTSAIAVDPDGTNVATSVGDAVVIVDFRTRQRSEFSYGASCTPFLGFKELTFSPDGKLLVGTQSGGIDEQSYVVAWRVGNYQRPVVFRCHDCDVTTVRFIPGTHRLVTEGCDGTVCVWDLDRVLRK
jgi:WD40 repeat protein